VLRFVEFGSLQPHGMLPQSHRQLARTTCPGVQSVTTAVPVARTMCASRRCCWLPAAGARVCSPV
jgi:hypothetical protein